MIKQQLKKVLFLIILFTTVIGKAQDISIEKAIYRDILPDLYLNVDFYVRSPIQDTVITIIGTDTSIYIRPPLETKVINAVFCDSCQYVISIANTMIGRIACDTVNDHFAKKIAEKYNIKWNLDSIPSAEFPYNIIKTNHFTFIRGSTDEVWPVYKQYGTTYIGPILLTRIRLDEEGKEACLGMVIKKSTMYSIHVSYSSRLKRWQIIECENIGVF